VSSQLEIDEIDAKILKILLKDARTSFADIAKECSRSTNSLRMRFVNMKKAGVITGSTVHLNPKQLGYAGIALIAIETDVSNEQNVLESLEKLPFLILSHPQIGCHNIISISVIKTVDDLVYVLDQVQKNPHIKKVDTAISASPSFYNYDNLFIEPLKGTVHPDMMFLDSDKHKTTKKQSHIIIDSIEKKQVSPLVKLDLVDLSIIRLLSHDARMSFRKIAKKLGITTKTVIERYKKLQKDVIHSTSITVNLTKLGYVFNAVFCITCTHQHSKATILEEMLKLPNVIVTTSCTGGIDVLAIAPLANFAQLLKLKKEMVKISGIKQIEVLLEETYTTWPGNVFSKYI
jgi:Lrp/AsnC family transcriptional regulator for asnA, asnC and gidA